MNETFYLTQDGKTCHMRINEQCNFFLELGLNAIDKAIDFYINTQRNAINYFYKEQTQAQLHKAKNFTARHKYTLGVLGAASLIASSAHSPVIDSQYTIEQTLNETKGDTLSDNDIIVLDSQGNKIETHLSGQKNMSKFYQSFFISKLDAFSKILMVTEGESHVFKIDNRGIMTAYGWNPVTSPTELNQMIVNAMGLNKHEKDAILRVSEDHRVQYVPKNLKKLFFTDKQIKASVNTMMNYYESDLMKVIKVKAQERGYNNDKLVQEYYQLPYNQQAVLVHMTYKVGATNLLKYSDFFDHLFVYFNKPTAKNLDVASKSFEYTYKNRQGVYQRDTRVEQMHTVFFNDCLVDKSKLERNLQSCREIARDDSIGKKIKLR